MGVILATFPLTYTAFDNSIAAGKLNLIYIILYFIYLYIYYIILAKQYIHRGKLFIKNAFSPGPVPTMFSEKPDETLTALKKSPEYAFRCLQALVSKLLTRGELTR